MFRCAASVFFRLRAGKGGFSILFAVGVLFVLLLYVVVGVVMVIVTVVVTIHDFVVIMMRMI